jgi:hypothetical protein
MSNVFEQSILNKSRLDKFILVINIPPLLRDVNKKLLRTNNTVQLDTMQFSVYGTIVPRIQVPQVGASYSGNTLHISSHAHPAYAPVTVNFTVDNLFNNYWMIFTWLNSLRDAKTGMYDVLHEGKKFSADMLLPDYATDFTLYGKDEYNNDIIKWVYKNAFPIELSEISYNYRTATEIESSFQFAFTEVYCELLQ